MNRTIDNPQPAFPRRIDHGIALLRISFGLMLFAHGFVLKLMTFGLAGTAGFFESIGFPGWTAYAVFAAETVGGLALIAGIGTRWVSVAILPVLLGALYVHLGNGWVFSNADGGWEYPLYLVGLPERPIENVRLTNCSFAGAKKPSIIENVANLELINTAIPRED